MLIHGSKLLGCPILSLHVGSRIAEVAELIVDPDTLKIIAIRVSGPLVGREMDEILPVKSIREFSRLGLIVDSADEFVEPDAIVQVAKVLKLNFSLLNLKVETKKGAKLGKVTDFTLSPEYWQVQQIIVQRPLLKSFLDPELTISYREIVEIDDYRIIIKDEKGKPKAPARTKAAAGFTPNFINPFREPDFAAEPSETNSKSSDRSTKANS